MRGLKNILCSFMLLVLASAPAGAAGITLRFAGQFPEDHNATRLMREIARGVRLRTNGRLSVEVFPANKLGDYTIIYEDLMRGAIDMALISIPSQFDPRLELVYLNPFVNYRTARQVSKRGSWLSQKMDEYNTRLGVKLLGFNFEGLAGIASAKPINRPLDPQANKGVLVRVPLMHVYKSAIESQGYRTVTIPYADSARAMKEGRCDAISSISADAAFADLKGIMKYWYQLNYSQATESYLMSAKTWDRLGEEDIAIIYGEVARASAKSIEQAKQNDKINRELMRKNGVRVFTYTDAELLPLRRAIVDGWQNLEPVMGRQLMNDARRHFLTNIK
ncbi:MAG: TRAP transporter substrate-binding protein DctP [bacterium]|nr:TRAP transporter substrate-binding protein DctP [bacterium]